MSWSDQEVLKYWEDPNFQALIANAIPLDEELGGHTDGGYNDYDDSEDSDDGLQIPTSVKDEDLTRFPFHSVGKLLWYDPETDKRITYSSAFYIGNGKIMSAAHGLKKVKEDSVGFFIPAMTNQGAYDKNYGHYVITRASCRPHPNYPKDALKPGYKNSHPEYDIFTADVGEGSRNDEPLDINKVGLISIDKNSECDSSTTWTAIGYSRSDGGKMKISKGAYMNDESTDEVIAMKCRTERGMSGGPWMRGNMANGCTSGGTELYSRSPRFSEQKIEVLI